MQKDILEHLLNQNIIKPSEEMLASNPFWAKKYFYKSGIQTQFPSIYHRFKYVIPEGSCVWRESINISLLTKSKVLVRIADIKYIFTLNQSSTPAWLSTLAKNGHLK